MSIFYLLRHGRASFGRDNYDRLSELGRRQAELTGRFLETLGVGFTVACCGTQARQRETAEAVLGQLSDPPPLRIRPEFDEYDSGRIISTLAPAMAEEDPSLARALPRLLDDRRSFQRVFQEVMARWMSGPEEDGSLETWPAFAGRVERGLERLRAETRPGGKILVVTSGGPISVIMRRALGLPDRTVLKLAWVIKNASLSSFLDNGSDFSLFTFNSTAHLEGLGDPGLITYR